METEIQLALIKGGNKMKSFLYTLLKIWNDVDAVKKGTVGKRIGRRVVGKATGRAMRRLFK